MSREKSKINDLQSKDREFPEKASVSIQEPIVISFDEYFRKALALNPEVHNHHKAPMRSFAEQRGLEVGTEKQFDEIFKSY